MTPRWFGELLRSIGHGRRKLVVMFKAHSDDSWTGKGASRVFTLSTLVAPAQRWEHFCEAWDGAMTRGGAKGKILHMKEFVHGEGTWKGWTQELQPHKCVKPCKVCGALQTQLLKRLVPVIRSHVAHGFVPSLPIRYCDEHLVFPGEKRGVFLPPYLLAAQACMESIVLGVKPTKDNPVAWILEYNEEYEGDVTKQLYYIAEIRGWKDLFVSITSVRREVGLPPLQAADFVVYEGSRYSSEHVVGASKRKPRTSYVELARSHKLIFKTADRQLLADYASRVLRDYDRIRTADPERAREIMNAMRAAERRMQRELDDRGPKPKRRAK